MKLLSSSIIKLFMLFLLINLAGCQSVHVRGQHVSDKDLEELSRGGMSKIEVIDLLGTPSYIPKYTENTWYYLQRSLMKRAWFDPKVVEQRIVKITFDEKGRLQEATLISRSHNENITMHRDFTKSYGTEQSGLQKFVKNIGRFNKTTDGKTKRQKKK